MTGFVAACSTVQNEADIIAFTVRHLFAEGVEAMWIADGMSTDGTRDILADLAGEYRITVIDDPEPYHRQPHWMNKLAHQAMDAGARWVIATDADEAWTAADPEKTVADVLMGVRPGITKVYGKILHYVDFEHRWPDPKPLPKVAYRMFPTSRVTNGNHDAIVPGASLHDTLFVREIQYRGFDHFCRKIVERNATIDPRLPLTDGAHHRQFDGWSREQLEPVWAEMVGRATVHDPIPTRVKV